MGIRRLLAALALAQIIAGEAPGCPTEAKLAIAHVAANRQEAGLVGGWFGRRASTGEDLAVALVWRAWPDPSRGALYAIGPGDRDKMPWLAQRTGRWDCEATFVETWR